jgi:hypothetical protein
VRDLTQMGGGADLLRPFVWSRLMRFRDGSDSECAQVLCKSGKKCRGDSGND